MPKEKPEGKSYKTLYEKLLIKNKELSAEISALKIKNQLIVDHNELLIKDKAKREKADFKNRSMYIIMGSLVFVLGIYLPVSEPEKYKYLLIFHDGAKFKGHIPIYSFLGIIIIFAGDLFRYIFKNINKLTDFINAISSLRGKK